MPGAGERGCRPQAITRRLRPRLIFIYPRTPSRLVLALPKLPLRLARVHGDDTAGTELATAGFAFFAGCVLVAASAAAADEAIAKARTRHAAPMRFTKCFLFPVLRLL